MVMYAKIRRMYYREHLSINEIQRRTSLSRNTIKKWLKAPNDSAVKYQRSKKPGKLTLFESRLLLALEADARRPKKDRRTALMLQYLESPRFFRRLLALSQISLADSLNWR